MKILAADVPDAAALGHVAAFRAVDAVEVADALAVLGILADAEKDVVVVNDGRGDDVAARAAAAEHVFGVFGVEVVLPEQLALERLEGVAPAVAAGEDHLRRAADFSEAGARPLAVQRVLAGVLARPDDFAGVAVHGDECGRVRRGQIQVPLVDPVGRVNVDEVADDDRRRSGQVVRKHAQLVDHVERPDDVGVFLLVVLLVLHRAVVFAVEHALDVDANQLAAIAHVIRTVADHARGRADALLGPVVHLPGGQLVVRGLPEELAGLSVEAEHHALVAFDLRAELTAVVRADEDAPAGDDRVAVCLGPERRAP